MREKHTNLIVRQANGLLELCQIRGEHRPHERCSAGHDTKVAQFIFWDKGENMVRTEGVVVALESCTWDYSKPVGQRAQALIASLNYGELLTEYRTQPTKVNIAKLKRSYLRA